MNLKANRHSISGISRPQRCGDLIHPVLRPLTTKVWLKELGVSDAKAALSVRSIKAKIPCDPLCIPVRRPIILPGTRTRPTLTDLLKTPDTSALWERRVGSRDGGDKLGYRRRERKGKGERVAYKSHSAVDLSSNPSSAYRNFNSKTMWNPKEPDPGAPVSLSRREKEEKGWRRQVEESQIRRDRESERKRKGIFLVV